MLFRSLVWTAALFAGDWLINVVHSLVPEEAPTLLHRVLSPPYGLIGVIGLWLWLAWRTGPPDRFRRLGVLAVVVFLGIALAFPWVAAVLIRLGWEYTSSLLHTEAVERTYYASRINRGAHWFYLEGLSYCMAPWSLLTLLFFSERLRQAKAAAWIRSEEHTSEPSHIQKSRMPSSA